MTKKTKAGYVICLDNSEYFAGLEKEMFANTLWFAHTFPYTEDFELLERFSKLLKGSVKELELTVIKTKNLDGSYNTEVTYKTI